MSAGGRLVRAGSSGATLLGGVTLAVVPAAVVSISARLFTEPEQGRIAVAVLVATFVGQLAFAVVVESRLASPGSGRHVVFPRWLALLGIATALVLCVLPADAVLLCVGLPMLVAALEVGRGVSVAERLDGREVYASIAVGAGALGGVLAGLAGHRWALVPLLAGIAVATLVRSAPVGSRPGRRDPVVLRWVLADTAITGVVPPLLNAMVLGFLGPVEAVLFTSVSTVSGLLAIPLNFMRLRLLKEHSRLDVVVSGAAVLGAVGVLLVLERLEAFGLLFGEAWNAETALVPLLVACGWRALSLATTIPFTALRRAGEVRVLTALRAVVSIATFALAAASLGLGSLVAVFAGLAVAEALAAVVYERAARARVGRRPKRFQPLP